MVEKISAFPSSFSFHKFCTHKLQIKFTEFWNSGELKMESKNLKRWDQMRQDEQMKFASSKSEAMSWKLAFNDKLRFGSEFFTFSIYSCILFFSFLFLSLSFTSPFLKGSFQLTFPLGTGGAEVLYHFVMKGWTRREIADTSNLKW